MRAGKKNIILFHLLVIQFKRLRESREEGRGGGGIYSAGEGKGGSGEEGKNANHEPCLRCVRC